jgi:proteasome assembly chaperone (PAC2) family protein
VYTVESTPSLQSPVLVMGLEGWVDAGLGGAAAMAALLGSIETEVVATFDTDLLLDHRSRRPTQRIVDGVLEALTWPELQLRSGTDGAGNDLLFLVGPEPDHQWRAFTNAIVGLSSDLGVRMAVGVGAFPAPVPHTRPVRLAATATLPELAVRVGFIPGTRELPAGVHAALLKGFHLIGVPALSLWARVPHYVAGMPYPAASAALVSGLAAVADLTLDSSELEEAATLTRQRIDELISQSDEHVAMVRGLEAQMDSEEEAPPPLQIDDIPTGDEIAAELERFLRGERGSS